jgi:hypothetical protein
MTLTDLVLQELPADWVDPREFATHIRAIRPEKPPIRKSVVKVCLELSRKGLVESKLDEPQVPGNDTTRRRLVRRAGGAA